MNQELPVVAHSDRPLPVGGGFDVFWWFVIQLDNCIFLDLIFNPLVDIVTNQHLALISRQLFPIGIPFLEFADTFASYGSRSCNAHIFVDVVKSQVARLLEHLQSVEFAAGDFLYAKDTASEFLYLLEEGLVQLTTPGGRTSVLIGLRCGEAAASDMTTYLCSATAITPVKAIRIPRTVLNELAAETPSFRISDIWFAPYQCSSYIQVLRGGYGRYYEKSNFMFHNLLISLARIAVVYLSIPYWQWLALI